MHRFDLPKSLKTQILFIDEQHSALLKIADELVSMAEQNFDRELLEDMVGFLVEYSKTHFEEEEKLMRSNNYEEYDIHCAEHEQFRELIEGIRRELSEGGDQSKITADVISGLKDWIINHVHNTDVKMAQSLKSDK